MQIPGVDTCVALMEQYAMLPNIRRHSLLVARIAELLAHHLQEILPAGQAPELDFCVNGALLHDIAKTPCLKEGCDHAATGAEICRKHGFPEIAEIVAGHIILQEFSLEKYKKGLFPAREIVYYADKRVRHDAIVSLVERQEYILENYGGDNERVQQGIRKNFRRCGQLEDALFSFLDFSPEQLLHEVDKYTGQSCLSGFPLDDADSADLSDTNAA
ncbi:MAG: HD domain-containing protein [Candidatus Electrothrix aestuarii]|uniref:HD domain-containing protein n=1 Tax=Candidatus Electrothrix aestuarii TaxID=3062594 RepID=A0AAU8LVB2_9BACT|nr:HDIG domain-containing protein [Candidatus Electrothrix aestuarii]